MLRKSVVCKVYLHLINVAYITYDFTMFLLLDYVEVGSKLTRELKTEGVDIIIALTRT